MNTEPRALSDPHFIMTTMNGPPASNLRAARTRGVRVAPSFAPRLPGDGSPSSTAGQHAAAALLRQSRAMVERRSGLGPERCSDAPIASLPTPPLVIIPDTMCLARVCVATAAAAASSPANEPHGASKLFAMLATGRVTMLLPPHVPHELPAAIAAIAAVATIRSEQPAAALADSAAAIWRDRVRPLARVVHLPIGEYLRPEIGIVARGGLSTPARPGTRARRIAGDADDLATAALAAFIGEEAVIWSDDGIFTSTGLAGDAYRTVDSAAQAAIAELALQQYLDASLTSARLLLMTITGAARAAAARPAGALALVLGAAAALVLTGRDAQLPSGARRAGRFCLSVGAYLLDVASELLGTAQAFSGELVTMSTPGWRRRTTVELCAAALARAGTSLSPQQLLSLATASGERGHERPPSDAGELSMLLGAHSAFVSLDGGRRWQLGNSPEQ